QQAKDHINKINEVLYEQTYKNKGLIPNYNKLIPNFNKFIGYNNPLSDAVEREKSAGVPASLIQISQSSRLKDAQNPLGLAVINRRDEPAGINQGINRYAAMGLNPKKAGLYAKGLIPNFAPLLIKDLPNFPDIGKLNSKNLLKLDLALKKASDFI